MISRQVFLRRLGAALAFLVLTGCRLRRQVTPTVDPGAAMPTCYVPVMPEHTPTVLITCYTMEPPPTETPVSSELTRQAQVLKGTAEAGGLPADATRQALAAIGRARLRACWLGLDELAVQSVDLDKGEGLRQSLTGEHQAALDDMVAAGVLDQAVAGRVQFAFEEAAYHVRWDNAPVECYDMAPGYYEPRADLVQQAEALSEVGSGLDPAAVEQAQEALRRDIAFLASLQSGQLQSGNPIELWTAGGFEVSEAEAAAAQFLIELLLGGNP